MSDSQSETTGPFAARKSLHRGHVSVPMPSNYRAACDAVDEIERLRAGWLRSIQAGNSCAATGQPCREPCGCVLEQAEWMEADNAS